MSVPQAQTSSKYPESEIECPDCGRGFSKDSTISYETHWRAEHMKKVAEVPKMKPQEGWPDPGSSVFDFQALFAPEVKQAMGIDDGLLYDGDTVSETGGHKGVKPEEYALLPVEPLAEVARVYGFGATKYAPRNWERGYEWSKSYSALQRHINLWWSGEETDQESGLNHLAHSIFHLLALIEFSRTHPEYDDRSKL